MAAVRVAAGIDPSADAAVYVSAALHALIREEQAGRRSRRLLEPGHATWQRFRGRLELSDFVELLLEDAAVNQPEPFDVARFLGSAKALRSVPDAQVGAWLSEFAALSPEISDRDYIEQQANRLGLKARPAFSDLHKLAPHHRVLEVPGSGGRLAAHAVLTQPGLSMKDMSVACASWQERMLAGLVAVTLDVRGDTRIGVDPTLEHARRSEGGFTHVFGLKPEKGGAFDARTLEGFFPSATIVLV